MVVANLRANVAAGQRIVTEAVALATGARTCPCESALAGAIMTAPDRIPGQVARRLGPIVSRYL
jgi:hypothetical protein